MKKIALLSMLTLALLLTQCKKKEVDAVTNSAEKVFITFNATNVGEKTVFHPEDGTFTWNAGSTEYIHVGGNVTGYLGKLSKEAGSSDFSGDIDDPSSNERLYFIYLGNGDKDIDASAESTTMDFSNQSSTGIESNVTNYHIAVGSAAYSASGEYSANMNMKMAIAYFDLSNFSGETVYMHGADVYSTATINFHTGAVTGTNGFVNLGTGGSSKFIAMISQTTPSKTTVKFDSNSKTGSMEFVRGIKAGSYYCQDATTALAPTQGSLPVGALPGLFSVSATKMVRFSKGNLQYDKETSSFSFMENQYDKIENGAQDVGSDYANQTIVSLFGWGTSRWNNGSTYYHPIRTARGKTNEGGSYGPNDGSSYTYDLTGEYANADWGQYNKIVNGGNKAGMWRTLTIGEWQWLLGPSSSPTPGANCRTSSTVNGTTDARFTMANVKDSENNDNYGMIIFPDIYTSDAPDGVTWNSANIFVAVNNAGLSHVTSPGWESLENAGCVFLPASGSRSVTTVSNVGTQGRYWSSSCDGILYAGWIGFGPSLLYSPGSSGWRYSGRSVRLVCDVN